MRFLSRELCYSCYWTKGPIIRHGAVILRSAQLCPDPEWWPGWWLQRDQRQIMPRARVPFAFRRFVVHPREHGGTSGVCDPDGETWRHGGTDLCWTERNSHYLSLSQLLYTTAGGLSSLAHELSEITPCVPKICNMAKKKLRVGCFLSSLVMRVLCYW